MFKYYHFKITNHNFLFLLNQFERFQYLSHCKQQIMSSQKILLPVEILARKLIADEWILKYVKSIRNTLYFNALGNCNQLKVKLSTEYNKPIERLLQLKRARLQQCSNTAPLGNAQLCQNGCTYSDIFSNRNWPLIFLIKGNSSCIANLKPNTTLQLTVGA